MLYYIIINTKYIAHSYYYLSLFYIHITHIFKFSQIKECKIKSELLDHIITNP